MKKLFLYVSLLVCSLISTAQKQPKGKTAEVLVVRDSVGNILPAEVWQHMVFQGTHSIKPVSRSRDTEFVLRQLTPGEMRKERLRTPQPRPSESFRTGRKFGYLNETDIDGRKFKSKELLGKVVVINYWFISCKPCRMEMPELNDLVDRYAGRDDIVFLGIALDDESDLLEFRKFFNFKYSLIANGRSHGIKSFPTHVIIDKKGVIRFHTSGYGRATVPWVMKTIDKLLSEPYVAFSPSVIKND